MNIAVIGLGLIGGSMALELKHKGFSKHIIGVDNSESHKDQALKLKIVDETCSIEEAIKESQLIILSTPVNVSSKIILSILNIIDDQILMDVGSTKYELIKKIKSHPKRKNFVATHPIAGTEFSGPSAAHLGLFKDKVNIICDQKDSSPKALNTIKEIYDLLEMKTIFMTAQDHDVHSAYVSHISHISSFSLALSVMDKEKDEKNILNMAGSGFESTVRLAKSSPEMWAPILELNKENIIDSLDEYIMNLNSFKNLLQNDKFGELKTQMTKTNYIKNILKGIK